MQRNMTANWTARLASLQPQLWLNRATPWVTLALILLVAHAMATLTWRALTPAPALTVDAPASRDSAPAPVRRAQSGLGQVAALHLFGVAGEAPVASEQAPIDAPETQLKLQLRGVFASDIKALSLAIIADAQGRESHYRIGAELPGNATLHEIYPDRVILRRNGRFEALNLPTEGEGVIVESTEQPAQALPQTTSARSASLSESAQSVGELRQMFEQDPAQVWKQVRITPHIEQGQIQGYRLSHNNRRLMRQIGLRPDDIVTSVNGMPLNDPTKWNDLMAQIQSADQVTLDILRRGQPTTLSVKMN